MNSNATTNIDGVPPVTAADLATLAGILITGQDIDDNPDDSERIFRAGAKAGIRAMCKSATSAINAFGALSLAQQAGGAPANQHGDAQSSQSVTPESGGGEQRPAPPHQARLVFSKLQHASLIHGEKRAGSIIDMASGVIYDVMLMPGELHQVTWAEAKAEITAAGGDLPTHDEILLLQKLLGSLAFRDHQYWTDEKVRFIGDSEDSISYFSDGYFEITEAADRMHARGIRRISVGDVAYEGSDPIDDSYVVVPAPAHAAADEKSSQVAELAATAIIRRLDGYMAASGYDADHPWRREIATASASQSWGLASAPESPPAPAEPSSAASDSSLLAEKMAKLVTRQRRASDLLEAMGSPVHVEAAGDLRSATGYLWDAVHEQVAINALPSTLDNWMTTPAGLARVLVGALRGERIKEPGEYNDAVEDCITAVVGTLSAGAGGDKMVEYQKQLTELSAIAPKVPVDDVVDVMDQLQAIGGAHDADSALSQTCALAVRVINGLIPHAGFGVEA